MKGNTIYYKGRRNLRVINMFITLIVVKISEVQTYIKTYKIIFF